MSAAKTAAKPKARAKRQRPRTGRQRRRELAAERERLAATIEAAIARLDQIDGDPDAEPDFEGEDTWDQEADPLDFAELDLAENEPSRNAPVSETLLGHAALRMPAKQPEGVYEQPVPVVPAERLPEPPEGYVAIRVLQTWIMR